MNSFVNFVVAVIVAIVASGCGKQKPASPASQWQKLDTRVISTPISYPRLLGDTLILDGFLDEKQLIGHSGQFVRSLVDGEVIESQFVFNFKYPAVVPDTTQNPVGSFRLVDSTKATVALVKSEILTEKNDRVLRVSVTISGLATCMAMDYGGGDNLWHLSAPRFWRNYYGYKRSPFNNE